MKRLFTRRQSTGATVPLDDLLPGHGALFAITDQSCCCPARPVVMAVIPATATRHVPMDLLLCGHHFHAHEAALQAAGASVYDVTGALISGGPTAAQLGAGVRQSSLTRAR